jgi:hypothetical protein
MAAVALMSMVGTEGTGLARKRETDSAPIASV